MIRNPPEPPTARQNQVFEFIQRFRMHAGKNPSMEMIAREIGVASTATVWKHVEALRKKGVLPSAARSATYHRAS